PKHEDGPRTAIASTPQVTAEHTMQVIRNAREGSSHAHSQSPATTAASTIRSASPSTNAPRLDATPWSLAVSPSTPSRTDVTWTSTPPINARPAESDHAAQMPITNASNEKRGGGTRQADEH